jgi:hypothetical protein
MLLVDNFLFKFVVMAKSEDNSKVLYEKWERDPNRIFSYNDIKTALDNKINKVGEFDIAVEGDMLKLKCTWKD